MTQLNEYRSLSFDCYGTLIDWSSGIVTYLQSVFAAHDAHVLDSWTLEQFGRFEPEEEVDGRSYRDVLAAVVDRYGQRLAFTPSEAERQGFADSIAQWPVFEDSIEALQRLAARCDLAIISNVDPELFAHSAKVLQAPFKQVTTAGEVGVYKPNPRMFEAAAPGLGQPHLHVAQSRHHDIVPAGALGWDTVWINRAGGDATQAAAEAKPNWTFETLAELADAMEA